VRRSRKIVLALVLLLAVAVAFNTIAVNGETESARAEAGARILELPGGDLQVREDGDSKGPPLVLLHGYTGSLHWWDELVSQLRDRFHVIRLDLLGHGDSEKPRHGYEIEEQARQIALALGQMDVEGATVVGHSMGGMIAIALATESSELVDRAVLIDSAPSLRYRDESLLQKLSYQPVIGPLGFRLSTDSVIRNGLEDAFAPGFEVPESFIEDFRDLTYSSFKHAHNEIERFLDRKPLDARAVTAAVPLLVIFGREDSLIRPAAAEDFRDVPGARIVVMPDAGHSPQVEKPEQTARLIQEFAADEGDEASESETRRR
jgi:pimeloyl-ACP methyl ester carboxylesterase